MRMHLLTIVLAWSLVLPNHLTASTQAGELTVVEVNPNGGVFLALIEFMEYFSAPGEFQPGMRWNNRDNPFSERTMWMIDGRTVRWQVGAAAMHPGRHFYNYTSRSTPEFINIYSHAPVIIGALQWLRDGEVELLRLAIRRFDTDAAVYRRYRAEIASDAVFLEDGEPSSRASVLQAGRMVRVLPAQTQVISTFTEEAVLAPEQLHENHHGMRTGYSLGAAEVLNRRGKTMPGCRMQLADGSEIDYGFDRKGYAVLDGNFIFSRDPLLHEGNYLAMGVYRGWTKAKYILARSNAMAAVDGRISAIDGDRFTLTPDDGSDPITVPVRNDASFRLNGQDVRRADALQVGRLVTLFRERPQVVEALSIGQPTPGYAGANRANDGQPRVFAIIDYDHEGNRRVLRAGYNPYFDDPKVTERAPSESAGPPGWTSISRAEAMRVHPDAEAILAATILRPRGD